METYRYVFAGQYFGSWYSAQKHVLSLHTHYPDSRSYFCD